MNPVETARGFAPMLAARADEIEAARRLPADIAAAFAAAGLYRLTAPRRHGGAEVAPAMMIEVIETLARADASAAWCIMIGLTSAITTAYLPSAVAAERMETLE